MKKIIILIPVFNDWESLKKLIVEISQHVKFLEEYLFEIIVINDASNIKRPEISKPNNINSLKILNMKKNNGHARCNAFGIRYINNNEKFDNIILMDGDGEDRPEEIKSLLKEIQNDPNVSVVAKRVKRSEGPFFQFLYKMHKMLTFIFTGKRINFGNYSCLIKSDVEKISSKPCLWSSFSGTVKKNISKLNEINSTRGSRYFGPSKMSLFKLLIHSFSIIAVFKFQVFLRSIFFIFILIFTSQIYEDISFFFLSLILIFNLIILVVSFRESHQKLLASQNNLDIIEDISR